MGIQRSRTSALEIAYQGTRAGDFSKAWDQTKNGSLREFTVSGKTYGEKELVWHHDHDYKPSATGGMGKGTMVLMFRSVHDNMHPAGGVWQANQYEHGTY